MQGKLKWSRPVLLLAVLALMVVLTAALAVTTFAVGGAAFTTFNASIDGASKDVCKNSAINCNIYGAKEYVWLNGGPDANHLKPDGYYFFAVLEPGGQPNPNDGAPKNLSDDFDDYTNRTFRTEGGEVFEYTGTHWLDSGTSVKGKKKDPDGQPPYIRLFPYADTSNPGGVYIMSICYLGADGSNYPVNPRDCKYDAFKVKEGRVDYQFILSGVKFEDLYAGGAKDDGDPGLDGWTITIQGTSPDGSSIDTTAVTGENGYWEWTSPVYTFTGRNQPGPVTLEVCEVQQEGWTQSYPDTDNGCHQVDFTPTGFDSFFDLDFGNWRPVDVTGCKEFYPSGRSVAGWGISLTRENVVIDEQETGADGCYTWTGLTPGYAYDLHEEERAGYLPQGPIDIIFDRAESGDSFSHTFVNMPQEGCTPGFWQGGSDGGQAGGKWLWNEDNDPDWKASGGQGTNPYIWGTHFNDFFTAYSGLGGKTMLDLVGTGGGSDDFQKAARSLVAAYLNASWGMGYAYSTGELTALWTEAVANGTFLALHTALDEANNAVLGCPISASGW